ncbi:MULTISPECIES: hypothetical protein [unclassified Romboutsia]|uniref:hypothetical protein n=1 Tax=unclassified Romboutsia TaxID=2626894 RepID=UPI00082338B5|nr:MULTISPECIES: hypothetical protein [unclassified Romboutsia]SCH07213.1 Uncharacterised protein [uncultured Clostridium sp.]
MNASDILDFRKIILCYSELGEKKLFKKTIKQLNINKKVHLYYSRSGNIPICALPKLRLVLASRQGFLSFCFNFFSFIKSSNNKNIAITPFNISIIAKCIISHEVGHILDPDISLAKSEYADILSNIVDKLIEYDIDITDADFYKDNLPSDLEMYVIDLKKNLINRESRAWDIGKTIIEFNSPKEEVIFNNIREYALATYNYGNLKNIVKEHNIDVFFKYRRYFA